MQERHKNRLQYFNEQTESTRKYVLPYILKDIDPENKNIRVLEVGCGYGGNLIPFLERGYECVGIELLEENYKDALNLYEGNHLKANLQLLNKNIYDVTPDEIGVFDIVFLRDVIEHIPEQEIFMKHLKRFVSRKGVVFFAFPPWRMPFGGHQQICAKKWVSRIPYMHIFPKCVYKSILKLLGSSENEINALIQIAETRISIERFRKIIRHENYKVIRKTHWFINPNYEIKFALKPRKIFKIFQIPYLQDFYTTSIYYLLKMG